MRTISYSSKEYAHLFLWCSYAVRMIQSYPKKKWSNFIEPLREIKNFCKYQKVMKKIEVLCFIAWLLDGSKDRKIERTSSWDCTGQLIFWAWRRSKYIVYADFLLLIRSYICSRRSRETFWKIVTINKDSAAPLIISSRAPLPCIPAKQTPSNQTRTSLSSLLSNQHSTQIITA